MVALGPSGTITRGSSHDYRRAASRRFFAETGTRWVRMWADWPTLMPDAGGFAPAVIDSLDEQIALARRDGLRVVVTPYRFSAGGDGVGRVGQGPIGGAPPGRLGGGGGG